MSNQKLYFPSREHAARYYKPMVAKGKPDWLKRLSLLVSEKIASGEINIGKPPALKENQSLSVEDNRYFITENLASAQASLATSNRIEADMLKALKAISATKEEERRDSTGNHEWGKLGPGANVKFCSDADAFKEIKP